MCPAGPKISLMRNTELYVTISYQYINLSSPPNIIIITIKPDISNYVFIEGQARLFNNANNAYSFECVSSYTSTKSTAQYKYYKYQVIVNMGGSSCDFIYSTIENQYI